MSRFLVPNTFIPGTKAKAQDINANFTAIQDEINTKAIKTGDISQQFLIADATEDNHAITKNQVKNLLKKNSEDISLEFSIQGFVKSGYMDENGNSSILTTDNNKVLLSFNVDDGTLYAPIVALPANNKPEIFIDNLESIDTSSYLNGVYNVFVNSEKSAYLINNQIFSQKVKPKNPVLNTIFKNISKKPMTIEKFNGTNWEEFNDVLLGQITISNSKITNIINSPFAHTYSETKPTTISTASYNSPAVIIENYQNGTSWYKVYSDGWCEQGGKGARASTVTYLKPFINTNYTITTNCDTSNDRVNGSQATSLTKNGCKLNAFTDNTGYVGATVSWCARGYIR